MDAEGDISLACGVTCFIRGIAPFIEKMQAAGYDYRIERAACPLPSHRQLLPTLWDLGIL